MPTEMVAGLGVQPGQVFTKEAAIDWFHDHYPLVKEGTVVAHLIRLSTNVVSRVHYNPKPTDDVFFQIDAGHYRLYDAAHDPTPIRPSTPGTERELTEPSLAPVPAEEREFAYEQDLRDYLARHLELIEPGLKRYKDEDITGVEFPVGGRFVDILAVAVNGDYVVIELQVSKGHNRVVGQLLRYIGWIEEHQAEAGQRVRGVIVAKTISDDLRFACRRVTGINLFEYDLSVTLRPVPSGVTNSVAPNQRMQPTSAPGSAPARAAGPDVDNGT